jgi:hypothetical protein
MGFHVGREMWRKKYVAELRALWEILLPGGKPGLRISTR